MHQSTATIDSPRRDGRTTGPVRLGSDEHKTLFCRMLLDSFDAYKPAVIDWPKLEADALARLVQPTATRKPRRDRMTVTRVSDPRTETTLYDLTRRGGRQYLPKRRHREA